ncbi:MAG: transcriptional regulator [Desulfovibrio sp.]|jgi:YHS domain-containing protein|nr:transcriptional regulator [Desulfovibrio sp.]
MWKWLILIAVVYVLYRLFANDILKKKKTDEKEEAEEVRRKAATGEMIKDPECGVYISADAEITVRDGDKIYRFCSYDCRDKFLQRLKAGGREISSGE